MFEKLKNFAKRLFMKPEGGINMRTALITGAAAVAGGFGLIGEGGVAGALLGGVLGVAGSALTEIFMPSSGADDGPEGVAASGGAVRSQERERDMDPPSPRGLPPQPARPPGRGAN